MATHPRRNMTVEVLHDTLTTPGNMSRAWFWQNKVSVDGRTFLVTQRSMTGAFDGDTSRALVEAYLNGTLGTQVVKEI